MIKKVISGGQTGIDQAALFAAEDVGIRTGGRAPKYFKTSTGFSYFLEQRFGLVDSGLDYSGRTELNVKNSDGTLQIAFDFNSPGEKCTTKFINKHNKPVYKLPLPIEEKEYMIIEIIEWIKANDVEVLNIAGNRQTRSRDSYGVGFNFLTSLFQQTLL